MQPSAPSHHPQKKAPYPKQVQFSVNMINIYANTTV
jgi:hypothetical protein